MNERMAALVGAAAIVTIAGRGLRPAAKLGMKAMVAAGDTLAGAVRGVGGLYAEVREDQRSAATVSIPSARDAAE